MKTNYPESKPRKIHVRTVRPNRQRPVLNTDNVIDTRDLKPGGFGNTFFLNLSGKTEKQSWKKLEKKFNKRLRDL